MKSHFINFYLTFVLFLGNYNSLLTAQIGHPLVRNYTPDSYNGGIQNWQITQDQRGVIYVANNFGLLQYDGNDWNNYTIDGISKLRSIAYHTSGKIYTGSQGDFGYFEGDSIGVLKYHSLKSKVPVNYQGIGETWKTYIINDKVYFCTFNYIYIFNTTNDSIEVVPYSSVLDVSFSSKNKIHTLIPNIGLYLLDGNKYVEQPYSNYFSDKVVSSVLSHSAKELLITTTRHGIYTTNGSSVKPYSLTLNTLFSESFINCAILLSNGNLAIGTQHNGIYIINQNGEILLNMDKDSGLLSRTILSLYEDHNQNLWVGQNNGISFIQLKSPFTAINEASSLPGTGYAAHMKGNNLYLGTNNGVYVNDTKSDIKLTSGSEGQVYSLQSIQEDLLIGHNNGSMKIVNNKASQMNNIAAGSWMFLEFGNYLLNGTYEGIEILELASKKTQGKIKGLNESSRILVKQNDSTVWMSHVYKGVYKVLFKSTNAITAPTIEHYNSDNGLSSDLFNTVHIIEGKLKVSTDNGIYSYDQDSNKFKIDASLNVHFKGKRIVELKTDIFGNIYFITTTSVGFLEKQAVGGYTEHTAPFNSIRNLLNDDLPNINIIGPSHVLFGAKEGFIVFDRNKFWTIEQENFKTLITKVQHKGQSTNLLFGGNQNHKSEPNSVDNAVEISYNDNTITFSFASSTFNPNSSAEFQYKLLGFDKNWQEWTSNNFKEYTNLREGLYTFQVKSKNANNVISDTTSYSFIVIHPWYRSPIAYTVYVLIGISMLVGLVLSLDKRHQLEKKKLEQKRLDEISEKETQLEAISKKSKDQINQLQNEKLESEIKHMNSELATNTMHILNKNEFISGIKSTLAGVSKKSTNTEVQTQIIRIIKDIENNIKTDGDWNNFQIHFEKVHGDFSTRIKNEFTNLSPQDIKLSAYLRLNLSTKEIANLLNISVRGVEIGRYRLRKKLDLDRAQNLVEFILNY